jgi:predicted acylesterase/phospholipase RssA
MFAAWEVGVWKALSAHFQPDLVVGASAGALNGWAIAAGTSPEELAGHWLNPGLGSIHFRRPEALYETARVLTSRRQLRMPFGLTIVEMPRLHLRLVRDREISWQHLAATCSIPLYFPPVSINGCDCVDGGLMGALPVWAAQEMGATRVIAVNCLNQWPFRFLRTILPLRQPAPGLPILTITPSHSLGSLRDALSWSRSNIERWIKLGEHDGRAALRRINQTRSFLAN